MRALPLLCLALCASAATGLHAQDRYSMRGVTVVREAGPSQPAPGRETVASYAPATEAPAAAMSPRPAAAPSRYLSWPGKRDPQPVPTQASFTPAPATRSTPTVEPARFVAPQPQPAVQERPTPSRYAPADQAPRPVVPVARQPSIYDVPSPPPVRARLVSPIPPARPESTHSLFRAFTDAAPAPERTNSVASVKPARVRAPVRTAQAAPAPVSTPAPTPVRQTAVASAVPVAQPAVRQQASLTSRRAPVRWDERPEFATPPAASPAPAPAPQAAPASRSATVAKASAKAPARNVAIPVAATPTADANPNQPAPGRTPYVAANGGTQARFYSVHREFGVRPDAIVMPKQFFLDGSPDMARPPPLPIPRITPTSGQSTAVQRAAAERSQEDPDAPTD